MKTDLLLGQCQAGLSYVELLVAAVIIAIAVMPVTDALHQAMNTADVDTAATVNHYRLVGKLDEVLTRSFTDLSIQAAGPATATAYSDIAGSSDRRLVFISAYDGDNADTDNDPFTGTDPGLLWIRVEIEGTVNAVQSLVTER